MTAIVTEFFRTPPVWGHLRGLVAEMPAPVLIWSAACGTGQEAYSAAMLCVEERLRGGRVIGSDVDEQFLDTARRGRFPANSVDTDVRERRLTHAQRDRFFDHRGDEYRTRPILRRRLTFTHGRLGHDPAPGVCDVVFARNVWRHLSKAEQERASATIHAALPPHGVLLLGGGDLLDESALRRWGALVHVRPAGLVRHFYESEEHDLIWRPYQ